MRRSKFLQRSALETLVFFVTFVIIAYFATGQESIAGSILIGAIGAVCYAGTTFVLRGRTADGQQDSR